MNRCDTMLVSILVISTVYLLLITINYNRSIIQNIFFFCLFYSIFFLLSIHPFPSFLSFFFPSFFYSSFFLSFHFSFHLPAFICPPFFPSFHSSFVLPSFFFCLSTILLSSFYHSSFHHSSPSFHYTSFVDKLRRMV